MSTVKMQDIVFSKEIFVPMKTNTPMDDMFSFEGGIFPATNYMIIGDPGSGKTTLGLDVLSQVQSTQKKRKVLFISAEMNKIDMFGFAKRYPKFNTIDILFTGEFLDNNIGKTIENELEKGYDLVLADSFMEIQESIMESNSMSRNQAEKWIIDLMNKHNLGGNKKKIHTAFLMIQQVTKGGLFAGSNKLKHNTTGMCELRMSKDYHGERFVTFTKNRRGSKHERLFYNLESNDDVNYNQKRLDRDIHVRKLQKQEELTITKDQEDFEKLLDSLPKEIKLPKKTEKTFVENDFNDEAPF